MQRRVEWHFDAARLAEALRVRDAVARLVTQTYPQIERGTAWVVLTELITNVTRHAPGRATVRVITADEHPVVHIFDSGPGSTCEAKLPEDPLSEGGRGLFIVSELSQSFELRRRESGGTHAIAVLR